MTPYDLVHTAAQGRWPAILSALGIPAEALSPGHGPCPGCGGSDRFRFDDRDGAGTWICGGGGELRAGDGFALLGHVLGMSPGQALAAVAHFLRVEYRSGDRPRGKGHAESPDRAELEAALLHELYALASIIQARATGRELAGNTRFRRLRPEWRPLPNGVWEREQLAAERILRGLGVLYGA